MPWYMLTGDPTTRPALPPRGYRSKEREGIPNSSRILSPDPVCPPPYFGMPRRLPPKKSFQEKGNQIPTRIESLTGETYPARPSRRKNPPKRPIEQPEQTKNASNEANVIAIRPDVILEEAQRPLILIAKNEQIKSYIYGVSGQNGGTGNGLAVERKNRPTFMMRIRSEWRYFQMNVLRIT